MRKSSTNLQNKIHTDSDKVICYPVWAIDIHNAEALCNFHLSLNDMGREKVLKLEINTVATI